MAYFSFVGCFGIIVVSLCSSTVQSVPHIIGGGWNPGLNRGGNSGGNPSYPKSVLPSLKMRRSYDNVLGNINSAFVSEKKNEGEIYSDENKSENIKSVNQIPATETPLLWMLSLHEANPFFRQKRQACQIPRGMEQQAIGPFRMNVSQILALNSTQSTGEAQPSNQPSVCPTETGSWWSNRPERNLLSSCPWNLTQIDLGNNSFPKYVQEARCLCRKCFRSDREVMECEKLKQNFTYFEFQQCQNGMAIMIKKTIEIVVGCYCAHPSPPQTVAPYE